MNCPECKSPLSEKEILLSDDQKAIIHECYNCGGHFIPPLIANLIPLNVAENLDSISPKNTFAVTNTPSCPICEARLTSITDDAVARGVTVFSCPENHGNYFPIRQLFRFKRAQKAKIDYHQIWGIPLKSAFAILLPVFAIFTAVVAAPTILKELQNNQENRVKASDIISRPLVTPIDSTKVIVSFDSKSVTTSQLNLIGPEGKRIFNSPTTPQTTHIFTLDNLTPNTAYTYTITIGQVTSELYSFTTTE